MKSADSHVRLTPACFSGDWTPGKSYLGYHEYAHRWNGWAIPYFTREVGDQIVRDQDELRSSSVVESVARVHFDEIRDAFVTTYPDHPGESDIGAGFDEGDLHLYEVGQGWTWVDEAIDLEGGG
ncbi:MAG: hypothetical protein WD757_03065 [Actinomycetota bacterium]